MEPGAAVCSDDVNSISCASYRFPRPFRHNSTALHGAHSGLDRQKEDLGIPLFRIRSVERNHNILGMQCDCRRRTICRFRQRIPDVTDIRAFPPQQEEILRIAPIYISHGNMDRVGKILFRRRDIMAMACARKCLCKKHMGHPVVRIHRFSWRIAMDLGNQPQHIRPACQPF